MGELVHQDRPGASHDAAVTQDDHAGQPAAATVRTMISRGRRSPDELAAVLRAHPHAQHEIMGLLHATLGNGFVQAVLSLLHQTPADGAAAPQGAAAPHAAAPHTAAVPHAAAAPQVAAQPSAAPDAKTAKLALGPVRVTAHGLRVRRTPDATVQDNVLGGLHHHAVVTALAHEGEWVRIEYQGETAYIHSDYVQPVAKQKPAGPTAAGDTAQVAEPVHVADPTPAHVAAPAPHPVVAPTPTPDVKAKADPAQVAAPAPTPTPTPTDDKHVAPAPKEVTPEKPADKPAGAADMFAKIYTTSVNGKPHFTQAFVSPGTRTETPDVFVFFHGHVAQYKIGATGSGVLSGIDVAAEAIAAAKNKNTIALLPQGNIGAAAAHGGHMDVLQAGLPAFLESIFTQLAPDLQLNKIVPAHIGLAGHSAGGYEGMHSALNGVKGDLADTITDVTLMDSDYSPSHYLDAVNWMFQGKGGKNLRIVEQAGQLAPTDHRKPKDKDDKPHVNHHDQYFQPEKLKGLAEGHGCTVDHIYLEHAKGAAPDVRASTNTVVQRSRIMKAGAVQADILIMRSSLGHHELRDSVMDDAILSIGEGEKSNDTFGSDKIVAKDTLKNIRAQEAAAHGTEKHAPAKHAPEKHGEVTAPLTDATGAAITGHATKASDEHAKEDLKAAAPAPTDHDAEEHPTHVDGSVTAPEKPKAKPSTAPAKAAGKEVYAKGGILSKEHLHQYSLTDAEFEFKGKVYDAAVARLGDKIYGGVPKDQLKPCDNGKEVREDVVGPLGSMLTAMRSAIAAKTAVNGIEVGKATGVSVTSGYRSPEHDRDLWDSYFQKYMVKTADERAATGDPLGHEAVKLMVHYIGQRKAPAGGSNHSNGIAVDLSMEMNGKLVGNNYDDQHVWKSSWHFAWLQANAATYGFKNYPKEHWHWDYKP
jgi:hypothetical protein